MPRLDWDLFSNPIANSASPHERSLSALMPLEATFETVADGGFGEARLEFDNVDDALIDEVLNTWMMKRVTATDAAADFAYEGFVFEYTVTDGYQTHTRSIDDFFNRAFVRYATQGGDCQPGATCYPDEQVDETDIDATYDSQSRIGIKEEWIDEDLQSEALANARGKQMMTRVLKPMFSSFQFGTGAEWQPKHLELTLVGGFATLQWRKNVLRYPSGNGVKEISAVLKNLLAYQGKSQYLDTEGDTFPQFESTGRNIIYNSGGAPVWNQDYVLDIIAAGSSTGKRLFFQIAPGLIPVLYTRKTAPTYYAKDGDWRVFNTDKGSVPPYLVRAGGYIQADNLSAPLDETTDVIGRGRGGLVEQTTYDAINDRLDIPPPASLQDVRRIWARQRKKQRGKR